MKQLLKNLTLPDVLFIIFYCGLTFLIILFYNNLQNGYVYILAHIIFIAGIFFVAHFSQKPYTFMWHFHNWYPWIGVWATYKWMENFIFLIFPVGTFFDLVLIHFEAVIFGFQPAIWLAETFSAPLIIEYMHFAYWSYYLYIPIGGLMLYNREQMSYFHKFIVTLLIGFFISFSIFVLFPVAGPRFGFVEAGLLSFEETHWQGEGYFFTHFVSFLIHNGALQGGAMPSSHCSTAIIFLVTVCRFSPKKLFPIALIIVTSMWISTIYGRYHYVVDVIAGIGIGIFALLVTPQLYRFWGNLRRYTH